MSRLLIQNACIYDGTGSKPFYSDILVEGTKIKRIGFHLDALPDDKVIDATGKALCPGFINTHSHMELELIKHPSMRSVINQGITTEVLGQDGSSVAPLTDEITQELADNMAPLAGTLDYPYPWRSLKQYMEKASEARPASRFVSLVGHGTIRMNVMGNDNRKATTDELEQMKAILEQCMIDGAKGMSLGLIYPPGSYADTDELIELAKIVSKYDGLIMVHMRNEKDRLLESIDEMAEVVRGSGVRLQISHHKALGKSNWGKVRQSIQKIKDLREQGFDMTIDQYPWTAASTGLKVLAPQWAFDGGEQNFQVRLRDPIVYKRILEETRQEISDRGGAEAVLIASVVSDEYSWMPGKRMDEISQQLNMEAGEAVLHILQHEGTSVTATYFSISEDDVKYVMQNPFHCVCTDGIVGAKPHPRAYGSFPRFLGTYVRDMGLMSMEEGIRHMTGEPAHRLRLWDRGLIREGMDADMVPFDPFEIKEANSYLNPEVPPVGICKVWVLGKEQYCE